MSFKVCARFGAGRGGDDRDGGLLAEFVDERTVQTTFVRRPDQCFSFSLDRVFRPDENTAEVHRSCSYPAVQQLMAGQNAALLAYGHGGSGKADTAFGSKFSPGLLSMTVEALFSMGLSAVTLTAVDVYNNSLRDLLSKSGAAAPGLRLRDSGANTSVEGATEVVLRAPGEEEALIPLLSNSRGHAVVVLRTPQGGKLFIVKLAHSDAGTHSRGASAEALEARKWSLKSFTALGSCLKAVADRARVIPVREGLLTRLLRDALTTSANICLLGHCLLTRLLRDALTTSANICLLGHCSTNDSLHEESVNTLRFIHRLCLVRPARPSSPPPSHAPPQGSSQGSFQGPPRSFQGSQGSFQGSSQGHGSSRQDGSSRHDGPGQLGDGGGGGGEAHRSGATLGLAQSSSTRPCSASSTRTHTPGGGGAARERRTGP
ncbi:P-loop containing nucleoside triphosphate hydrolase protein [Baffinella frigidus]|nr:P-loop containing nucleoside triphosphate hydrolase protein [Cryptophyta sp. CCMP2293]